MKDLTKYLTSAIAGIGLFVSVATAKAETLSGKVIDALTSQIMNSFPVALDRDTTLTDQNGNYNFDVPVGIHHLKISDNITDYFNYEEDINLTTDTQKNIYMIPVKPVDTRFYSDFLGKFKYMTKTDGSSHSGNTKIYWWRDEFLPIPVWYNEDQAIQIHDQDIAQKYFDGNDSAIREWENKSGIDLFQKVDENPTRGIKIDYSDSNSRVGMNFLEDKTPQNFILYISNTGYLYSLDKLRMVFEHELGHCVKIEHSPDPNDNMHQPALVDISQNEADIVRIIYTLPNFIDMSKYNSIKSRNAVKDWKKYE